MKIAGVSWAGVAGLADGSAEFTAGGTTPLGLVVISGPPGSGKSRLLATIAHTKERLAAYGPVPPDELVSGKTGAAKVSIQWWLSANEQRVAGLRSQLSSSEVMFPRPRGLPPLNDPGLLEVLGRYSHDPAIGKVDYIPAERVRPATSGSSGGEVAEQRRRRLSTSSDKYASIKQLAWQCMQNRDPRIAGVRRLFAELCPGRMLGNTTEDGDIDLLTSAGAHTPLRLASSSEWEAFTLAATFVLCGLQESVVLYDSPELHLDGVEAARRLGVLRAAAPTSQFIVATRSVPILEAAGALVRLGGGH